MNIEELTKTQLILLTLLVAFVTSIATGIVTASLLQEAPQTLTQTINRVVERTVERVVPDTSTAAATVAKEKETTVVVKEDDLVTSAIAKNSASLVRLTRHIPNGGTEEFSFAAIGVILTKDGLVATDDAQISAGGSYIALLPDGTQVNAKVVTEGAGPIALLSLDMTSATTTKLTPITIGGSDSLKLGQSIVGLSGRERTTVATGIISGIISGKGGTPAFIETTVGGLAAGAPVINVFGDVVGLSTGNSREHDPSTFTPGSVISAELKSLSGTATSTQTGT